MDVLAIAGLAGLVLLKEAGVPLPVPGDLLIIGAGATLAGDLPAAGVVPAIILVVRRPELSCRNRHIARGGARQPRRAASAEAGQSERIAAASLSS